MKLNYIGYSNWRLFSINEVYSAEYIRWSGADVAFVIQFDVNFLKFIWAVA